MQTIGKGSSSACLALGVHPFNEFVASGSSDSCLRLHDLRDGVCLHTYKGHRTGISHVRFAPDGRLLASASADGCVRVRSTPAAEAFLSVDRLGRGALRHIVTSKCAGMGPDSGAAPV